MTKRKHNLAKRRARHSRAVLRQYNVCVIHTDWGQSGLLNWKQVRPVLATPTIASAVTDERYHWTIYLAGLAVDAHGKRYTKGVEVAAGQPYRADELAGVMQAEHEELIATIPAGHLVGEAWIAFPYEHEVCEDWALGVFEAVGGWNSRHEEQLSLIEDM